MPRTRPVAVAAVLLLLVPALLVATPAALAEDVVPHAPSVRYQPLVGFTHRLYVNFDNLPRAPQPDCTTGSLGFGHADVFTSTGAQRSSCAYPIDNGQAGTTTGSSVSTKEFSTGKLARSFNVTGNDSLVYVHKIRKDPSGRTVPVPAGATLTVTALSGTRPVAAGSLTFTEGHAFDNDGLFAIPLEFLDKTGRATFDISQAVTLQLKATMPNPTANPTPPDPTNPTGTAGTPTYTIDDTGAYLEVRSVDAMRAAAWVGDPSSPLAKTVFRPVPNSTPLEDAPRIQLFFSVQSAFGVDDAASGGDPSFIIKKNGEPQAITPSGDTKRGAAPNATLRITEAGIATWTLPGDNPLDYRGFAPGEYVFQANARHGQGASITRGDEARFFITAQGVRLTPYADATRPDLPAETPGHNVAPGDSTTYLLLVNNTGDANDTFRVDATFVAGTPATGWSAVVGGPDVRQRHVEVPAGESRLVTVTVYAPFAAPGASSIFRVNATSTVDPSVVSPSLTLSTTVSSALRREVAVLVPRADPVLEPGVDTPMPVYVWNRGTRAGNFSLDLIESPVTGWTVDLLNGDLPVQRLVLSNVPAGGIAEATLRANGPISQAGATYPITLNATSTDVPGVAGERAVRLALRTVGGVAISVLDRISGFEHIAEAWEAFVPPPGPDGSTSSPGPDAACATDVPSNPFYVPVNCFADNASGVWWRAWITNTGKTTESFDLRIDNVDFARVRDDCDDEIFGEGGHEPGSDFFRFFARTHSGRPVPVTTIDQLPPGKTAEVYVWRAVDGTGEICEDSDTGVNHISFVVTARGQTTGAIASYQTRAIAENNPAGGRQQVLIEAVGRTPLNPQKPDEGPFLVDVANATLRSIESFVPLNGTTTHRFRVTHAASWGAFTDDNGKLQEPRLVVRAQGVDKEAGWNVSIRRVLDQIDNPPTYGNASVNFTNERDGRVEAWIDYELEVTIKAPSAENGTAFAGKSHVFFLVAEFPGRTGGNTFKVTTTIAHGARIDLSADTGNLALHAGKAGAALLLVKNVGGSEANATLRAVIDPATPNAANWRVEPASLNFRVAALHNRTVALLVTPPAGTGPGSTANVLVSVEYTPTVHGNATLTLPVTVAPPGTLEVTAPQTDATIAPGGYANFTLNVRNRGNLPAPFRLTASALPEWEASIGEPQGTLGAGESRSIAYVLRAPPGVENEARFASVARVVEIGNDANFDAQPLTVHILGGKAAPFVSAPLLQKRVDRGGVQVFPIEIRNTGNAAGLLPLEVRAADPSWAVAIQNGQGENVTSVRLTPNELAVLNVTVRPPLVVPERTVVPLEVTAYTQDYTQSSKVTLRAEIQDYGLSMSVTPARLEAAPGVVSEFLIKVRNLGNDNDTINVSAHLPDLPLWTVTLSTDRVLLQAGQEGEVRATVKSPSSPLPTPRAYSFKFFAGTIGGAAVNLPKNESAGATVTILPYRSMDVDGDEQLELAVDADGRTANGFESFREISNDGVQSNVVALATLDGKVRFLLDVPNPDSPYDGIADAWFDPEAVYVYKIAHRPDLNDDGTPDYLLDTDRDAKVDRAYDTVTETYWNAVEVKAFNDQRVQYLVDTDLDGRPDVFYDPEREPKRVSKTQKVSGQPTTVVGIDTDDDGKVDKYYDTKTKTVSDAAVAKASGLFTKYWWFFALFGAMVLVTILLLVARRRRA